MRCHCPGHVGVHPPPLAAYWTVRRGGVQPLCRAGGGGQAAVGDARGFGGGRVWVPGGTRGGAAGGPESAARVALILRGPGLGVPSRLRSGVLPCSRCFRLLPQTKENFDLHTYRVEPVCRGRREAEKKVAARGVGPF